jgi:hypothetical protein
VPLIGQAIQTANSSECLVRDRQVERALPAGRRSNGKTAARQDAWLRDTAAPGLQRFEESAP